MVAAACERVMDLITIITSLIFTVDTSNEDQALLINFRKKDIVNNISTISFHVDAKAARMETMCFLILF